MPSERIGSADSEKRRHPICMPPSKRMTISATTAMRSTVTNEIRLPSSGQTSEAAAATRSRTAALGTARRSLIVRPNRASRSAPDTTSTISPNAPISAIGRL